MKEHRTWEQIKKDNDGAVWIDSNGEFCANYKRDMMKYAYDVQSDFYMDKKIIAHFQDQQSLLGWQQIGFNGCWSCDNNGDCEAYNNSFIKH